jgi:cell division protein FtsN
MRRAKLFVYIAALGTGLVFGSMLSRHLEVPAPPRIAPQGVLQHTIAPTPRTTYTSHPVPTFAARPPAPETRTPRRPDPSPARAPRPSAFPIVAPSPIPVHQSTVVQTSGASAAPEPQTAAHDADQPSSFVITPASDTPVTAGAQQAAGENPRVHVQVGVFRTPEDSQALVQRLHLLGYAAASIDGDTYRVWVGGYVDRETAERLAATLRKAGFDATLVP